MPISERQQELLDHARQFLPEDTVDAMAEEFESLSGTRLREQVKEFESRARRAEAAIAKSVFAAAGWDGDPSVLNHQGLDVTDLDAVRTWLVEKRLIAPPPPSEEEQQVAEALDGHEGIAAATAGAKAPAVGGGIDSATVAGWDMSKYREFERKYPEAVERISRGETVHGITF